MTKQVKLLFIHGAGGTKSKWRTLVPHFTEYDYEAIDVPGHGENTAPLANSIEEKAAAISEGITEDTIVIGHSMGGLIAIELASINAHVKGIVLLASFYELPVHPKMLANFDEGVFPDAIFFASYSKDADEALIAEEQKERELTDMKIVSNDFHACNNYQTGKEKLAALTIPVLALYGTEDRLITENPGEKLQAVNENVDLHAIEAGKHYIMLENPQQTAPAIKEFYEKVINTL